MLQGYIILYLHLQGYIVLFPNLNRRDVIPQAEIHVSYVKIMSASAGHSSAFVSKL